MRERRRQIEPLLTILSKADASREPVCVVRLVTFREGWHGRDVVVDIGGHHPWCAKVAELDGCCKAGFVVCEAQGVRIGAGCRRAARVHLVSAAERCCGWDAAC